MPRGKRLFGQHRNTRPSCIVVNVYRHRLVFAKRLEKALEYQGVHSTVPFLARLIAYPAFMVVFFIVFADIIEIGKKHKGENKKLTRLEAQREIERLTAEMREAARTLEFEKAAYIRDRIIELKSQK